ncbi:hypothetical protein ACLGIH_33350 [Streptomyces sp. HMX87]|uniref:hypothetical protein n=1 Tax=Streptomyces sp. HMX87 TaxID=3390849 RepID=UPI003A88C486
MSEVVEKRVVGPPGSQRRRFSMEVGVVPQGDPREERYDVRSVPESGISRTRMVARVVLTPLLRSAATWLAVVELGHGPFLHDIALVAVVSFVVASAFLLCGVWLRRREEHRGTR